MAGSFLTACHISLIVIVLFNVVLRQLLTVLTHFIHRLVFYLHLFTIAV